MSLGARDESSPGPDRAICSAKGCREAATVELSWRNPTLHHGGRLKHWLACDQHADHLADFLDRRRFLLDRTAFGSSAGSPPPG